MPNCLNWREIEDLADGAGSPSARRHIADCARCARLLEKEQSMREAARGLAAAAPAEATPGPGLYAALAEARRVRPMSCRRAARLANLYLDGRLAEKLREDFEAHLFACDACYGVYRASLEVKVGLSTAVEEPPEGLAEKVLAGVTREAAARRRPVQRWRVNPAWAMSAAALIAAVATAWLLLRARPEIPTSSAGQAVVATAPYSPSTRPTPAVAGTPAGVTPAASAAAAPLQVASPPQKPASEAAFEGHRSRAPSRSRPARVASAPRRAGGSAAAAEESEAEGSAEVEEATLPAMSEAPATTTPPAPATSAHAAPSPRPLPPVVAKTHPRVQDRPVGGTAVYGPAAPAPMTIAMAPSFAIPAREPASPAPATGSTRASAGGGASAAPAHAPSPAPAARPAAPQVASAPVRIAEAPEDTVAHWLPMRAADAEHVVAPAAPRGKTQLDDAASRVNQELRRDALATGARWFQIK